MSSIGHKFQFRDNCYCQKGNHRIKGSIVNIIILVEINWSLTLSLENIGNSKQWINMVNSRKTWEIAGYRSPPKLRLLQSCARVLCNQIIAVKSTDLKGQKLNSVSCSSFKKPYKNKHNTSPTYLIYKVSVLQVANGKHFPSCGPSLSTCLLSHLK